MTAISTSTVGQTIEIAASRRENRRRVAFCGDVKPRALVRASKPPLPTTTAMPPPPPPSPQNQPQPAEAAAPAAPAPPS